MPVIATTLATALGGGVLATAVSKVVVGLAFNAISSAITARLNKPDRAFSQQNSRQSGAIVPQAFGVGRYSTVGSDITAPLAHDRRYEGETFQPPPQHTHPDDPQPPLPEPRDNVYSADETGQGRYLTLLIALSDMPITGVGEVLMQGQRFVVGADLVDAGDPYGMSVPQGRGDEIEQYRDKLWIKIYDGTQTQADPVLMRIYGNHKTRPITSDMTYAGGAYAIVTVENDSELWTNLREIRFVIDGRKIDGAFTQNAVQIAAELAVGIELPNGERFTAGYGAADIDADALSAAIAEVNGAGFTCGLEIPVGTPDGEGITALDAMDQILNTCNGTATDVGGRLYFDALSHGMPVVHLTSEDVDISRVQTAELTGSLSNKVNRVSITHPSPDDGWAEKATPIEINAAATAEDGQPLAEQVSLPALNNSDTGRKLAQMLIADSRKVRIYAIPVRMGLGFLRPKQKVTYSSEVDGFANKEFMVETMAVSNGETILTIRETDPDDFNPANINLSPYQPVAPATVYAPPLSIQVAAVARTIGAEGGTQVAGASIYVDRVPPSALGWTYEARIVGQTNVVTGTASRHTLLVDVPLNGATDYEVKAIYISETRAVVWSDWVPVTTGNVGPGSPSFLDQVQAAGQELFDLATARMERAINRVAEVNVGALSGRIVEEAKIKGVVEGNRVEAVAQLDNAKAQFAQEYVSAVTETAATVQFKTTLNAEIAGGISAGTSDIWTAIAGPGSALAEYALSVVAEFDDQEAYNQNTYLATADLESAIATNVQVTGTTLNGLNATVTEVTESENGTRLLKGWELKANGTIGGGYLVLDSFDNVFKVAAIWDVADFTIGTSDASGDFFTAFSVQNGIAYLEDLVARTANIDELAVTTLKIDDDAVTVGSATTRSDTRTGTGGWLEVHVSSVVMFQPGKISIKFNCIHSYTNGFPGHELKIRLDGVDRIFRGGTLGNDYPNISFATAVGIGTAGVRVFWKAPSSMLMPESFLEIDGVKK